MISVISGYEIAVNIAKSEKLSRDVEKFLKKGNEIKILGKTIIKEVKATSDKSFKKERITEKRRDSRAGFKERLQHQQDVLSKYLSWYSKPNSWRAITDICEEKVSPNNFYFIMKGLSTISNQKKWIAIEKAISKLRKQHLKEVRISKNDA